MMGQTEKMVLEVPVNLAHELESAKRLRPVTDQELLADLLRRGLRDLRIEQALEHYKQGGISFAAAAEQAGVTQPELARAAYVRAIEPPYDEAMVAEELG